MSRSWLRVLLALAISFVYEKSGSAGPETPAEKAWPVIEPTIKDLAYAEKSPDEKLDLYLPAKESGPAPVVIWIHGGGFIEGDKGSMPRRHFGSPPPPRDIYGISQIQVPNVAALVVKGYAVVSLNYRLGTSFVNGALPATQDGKAAVRFLRANASKYGLDPNRFAVCLRRVGGLAESGHPRMAAHLHSYHRRAERIGRRNSHSDACHSTARDSRQVAVRRSREGRFTAVSDLRNERLKRVNACQQTLE